MAVTTVSRPAASKGLSLPRLFHDLRHRRERFRQLFGIAFVLSLTLAGRPTFALLVTGTVIAVLGMSVRLWASGWVKKNTVLATGGPYAFARHPLYVGNILICAGFCLASGQWWSAPSGLAFLLLFYPPAIRYEDRKLQRMFPGQWEEWSARTRALIPSVGRRPDDRAPSADQAPSGSQTPSGRWSLRQSLFENGEPVYAVLMLFCLGYLGARLP